LPVICTSYFCQHWLWRHTWCCKTK